MSCINVNTGLNVCNGITGRRYYQKIVLINKDDVKEHVILPMGMIRFQLKENKSGILFKGKDNLLSFNASVSQVTVDGIPNYVHSVTVPVFGVSAETKAILRELVSASYFAAIMFIDGTIEIYGFHNLLKAEDYDYSVQTEGGLIITLSSPQDNEEDDLPYIYTSDNPIRDFENLFQDVPDAVLGDFSDDFSNDFDI